MINIYKGFTPHRGLDPRSPANINTEELRHRDYNQKETLLLCVSVFIQRNNRMRLRVKPAMRKAPTIFHFPFFILHFSFSIAVDHKACLSPCGSLPFGEGWGGANHNPPFSTLHSNPKPYTLHSKL